MSLRLYFFNDTATTEIYTLSLHDALPISAAHGARFPNTQGPTGSSRRLRLDAPDLIPLVWLALVDRKSTRLNSSHANISYAVFCLKKKHIIFLDYLHPLLFPSFSHINPTP